MPYYCHLRDDLQKLVFNSDPSDIVLIRGPEEDPKRLVYLDELPIIKESVIEVLRTPKQLRDKTKGGLKEIRIIRIGGYRPVFGADWKPGYRKVLDPNSEIKKIEVLQLSHPNILSREQPENVQKKLASYSKGEYFATLYRKDEDTPMIIGFYTTSHFRTTVNERPSYAKLRCSISI